jgi:hypothetical protein
MLPNFLQILQQHPLRVLNLTNLIFVIFKAGRLLGDAYILTAATT